jgi:hypothetical protein
MCTKKNIYNAFSGLWKTGCYTYFMYFKWLFWGINLIKWRKNSNVLTCFPTYISKLTTVFINGSNHFSYLYRTLSNFENLQDYSIYKFSNSYLCKSCNTKILSYKLLYHRKSKWLRLIVKLPLLRVSSE